MKRQALALSALLLAASLVSAQNFTTGSCNGDEGNTSNNTWFGGRSKVCEVRRVTLPLVNGRVAVKGKNGGIEMVGEDRSDIELEARVVAQASSRDEAQELLRKISIETHETIQAHGPEGSLLSHSSWSVNYKLRVPRRIAARLHTENGGISVENVDGKIEADTTNGGLSLSRLAGEVHAETINGGLDVTLEGQQWHGEGMIAKSTNGGVTVKAPEHYSAHLVANTVNGGIEVGFPITVQGKIRNHIDANIGNGGPTLQFDTVNGGVTVERR